jgi:hypothetical protein
MLLKVKKLTDYDNKNYVLKIIGNQVQVCYAGTEDLVGVNADNPLVLGNNCSLTSEGSKYSDRVCKLTFPISGLYSTQWGRAYPPLTIIGNNVTVKSVMFQGPVGHPQMDEGKNIPAISLWGSNCTISDVYLSSYDIGIDCPRSQSGNCLRHIRMGNVKTGINFSNNASTFSSFNIRDVGVELVGANLGTENSPCSGIKIGPTCILNSANIKANTWIQITNNNACGMYINGTINGQSNIQFFTERLNGGAVNGYGLWLGENAKFGNGNNKIFHSGMNLITENPNKPYVKNYDTKHGNQNIDAV